MRGTSFKCINNSPNCRVNLCNKVPFSEKTTPSPLSPLFFSSLPPPLLPAPSLLLLFPPPPLLLSSFTFFPSLPLLSIASLSSSPCFTSTPPSPLSSPRFPLMAARREAMPRTQQSQDQQDDRTTQILDRMGMKTSVATRLVETSKCKCGQVIHHGILEAFDVPWQTCRPFVYSNASTKGQSALRHSSLVERPLTGMKLRAHAKGHLLKSCQGPREIWRPCGLSSATLVLGYSHQQVD